MKARLVETAAEARNLKSQGIARMRLPTIPHCARHIRTYGEFEGYLTDFSQGIYPFLWIVGRSGLMKTESIKRATRTATVYYRKGGQLTPLQFYKDLFEHQGQPVILDDAEHLLELKIGGKLVSALGETTIEKRLDYGSTTRNLGNVPQTFFTTSPLCIIANQNTRDAALQSRAILLYFDPPNAEVHQAVSRWYWDQEIHDWFGQHLARLKPLDCRSYLHADRDKTAHRDWRKLMLDTHGVRRISTTVQDLETDPAYPTREDKAQRFVELMRNEKGASRPSYFRIRRKLESNGALAVEAVPSIRLFQRRPSTPTPIEIEALAESPPPRKVTSIVDSPDADRLPWERPVEEDEPSIP